MKPGQGGIWVVDLEQVMEDPQFAEIVQDEVYIAKVQAQAQAQNANNEQQQQQPAENGQQDPRQTMETICNYIQNFNVKIDLCQIACFGIMEYIGTEFSVQK